MMREVPVRDTDPDPYNSMASQANQEDDRFSPVAFTVDFGNSLGSNTEEKNKKLERFALRSSQRKVLSPSPGSTARPSSASRTRQKDRSVSANRRRHRGEEIKFSLVDNKVRGADDDSYQNDTFESDSDEPHAGRENVQDKVESNPSETGTYTVDKDDDSPASPQTQESRLESLMEENKSSYVEEWATKHAFPLASPPSMSLSPDERKSSVSSTRSSSRRMLPRPPSRDREPVMEELLFSPESEQGSSLTPPRTQESEAEDEFSFMAHTQHLVDVMEERLKQKTLKKLEAKSTRSPVTRNFCSAKPEAKSVATKAPVKSAKSSGKSNMKSPEPTQDALEAWKRRKNYDPLAAAGRKKSASLTRKHSAGSSVSGMMSPPQDDTSESESLRERRPASRPGLASRQPASAPGSAKSRSSGSSGYISRGTERLRRQEEAATPVTRAVTAPLRRLAHTNSSSAIKPKQSSSSRSSSSLTSKEAEFQAWKRRKNYDPMKAASKSSSSKAKESRKVSAESCRSYASSTTTTGTVEPAREVPRHKRLVDMSSREMTRSLVMEELTMDTPMQRSNSFHCNAKKNGRIQSEDESEEDFGSGYESSLADSQIRSYPHFYLDDDELIMPIQSSHSRLSGHRSLMSSSRQGPNQISPSKGRSKLEALDTLVISTIHNVSNKLCSSSAGVLRQAAAVFPEQDEEQASTLETVIYLLEDMDLPPSPAKKTSRELSGTLRNLKKIEQALEMMKKLMDSSEILED